MRRFIDQSEGDSIFNYEKDVKKKTKERLGLGMASLPRQSFQRDEVQVKEALRNSSMNQMLRHYKSKPEDVIQDAKRQTI